MLGIMETSIDPGRGRVPARPFNKFNACCNLRGREIKYWLMTRIVTDVRKVICTVR